MDTTEERVTSVFGTREPRLWMLTCRREQPGRGARSFCAQTKMLSLSVSLPSLSLPYAAATAAAAAVTPPPAPGRNSFG